MQTYTDVYEPVIGNVYGMKRSRADNATSYAATARPAVNLDRGTCGSATVVGQVYRKRSKTYGRKKAPMQKMLQLARASQNYFISRWQALTTFNSPTGAQILTNEYLTASAANFVPLVAFNISACALNYINDTTTLTATPIKVALNPAYRLYHEAGQWQWAQLPQVNGGELGGNANYNWNLEYDHVNSNVVTEINTYSHDWTEAKFVFKGANQRPIKIHTALARFEHTGAGPMRMYYNSKTATQETTDSPPEANEIRDGCIFWDHFWATKLANPIRTMKQPMNYNLMKPAHMWNHESFVLGEDVSINNDTLPLQLIDKKFMRFDKIMTCENPNIMQQQMENGITDTTRGSGIGAYPGYDQNPATGPTAGVITSQQAYPQYNKDTYLVVWADVFDQAKDGVYPGGGTNADYSPSFDINLRCRYSYND